MPNISKDSVTSVKLVLQVDGGPHFLVMLSSVGHVKRMGYSALARSQSFVAAGTVDHVFQHFMDAVHPALFAKAGTYQDPGSVGSRCQWRIEFETMTGPVLFDLTYHAGSAGLPPAMAQLVEKAESLTDSWYEAALPMEEPTPAVPDPEPQAAEAPPEPEPAGVAPGTVTPAEKGVLTIGEYLSFDGRIGRMDYIMLYGVPLFAITFVGGFADGLVGLGSEDQLGPMGIAAVLLTIWPSMAGWAKRLHDFNRSLWIVPAMSGACGAMIGLGLVASPAVGMIGLTLWGLAMFALFLATYLMPGTNGPNQYGPPRAF